MESGQIFQAKDMMFLALTTMDYDSRQYSICTVIDRNPYLDTRGVINIIMSPTDQYYHVPAIGIFFNNTLKHLQVIDTIEADIVHAVVANEALRQQVLYALADKFRH